MVGILVYLDHADLCDIADGKASDLADLQDAMDYAKARLLVSSAHIIDLAGADSPTCERWLNAASMFGPVEFSIEPGNVTTSNRTALAEHIEAARPYFPAVRHVGQTLEEASKIGVEASYPLHEPRLSCGPVGERGLQPWPTRFPVHPPRRVSPPRLPRRRCPLCASLSWCARRSPRHRQAAVATSSLTSVRRGSRSALVRTSPRSRWS